MLESLLSRAERSGNKARIEELERELDLPYMPIDMYPLWGNFLRLSRRRDWDGMSGMPKFIRHTDIIAYQQLAMVAFTPWEVEQIEILDNTYIKVISEAKKADKPDG